MEMILWYLIFAALLFSVTQCLRLVYRDCFPAGFRAWGYDLMIHLLWLPMTAAAYAGPAPITHFILRLKKIWGLR